MKFILAYNPLPDIKKWAVEKALGHGVQDINALATGSDDEKKLFDKCTKFFGSFRKYFEMLVPVPAKFGQYNQIYSGAMADLGKNESSRDDFFGLNFDINKVEQSTGNYPDFKNDCDNTNMVEHLNDALGTLTNNTFKNAMNQPEFKRKVNAEIQKFSSGGIGIEQFYQRINQLQNSMERETGVSFEKKVGKGEAWASIGAPVMSQGEYSCYCVRRWQDMNAVAGFSNWCVAQSGLSGRNYFDGDSDENSKDGYIYPNYDKAGNPTIHAKDKKNAYYLICKGKTPVALFNIATKKSDKQFKNVGDAPYEMDRPSSKDVVGLALQIRNHLGDSSTNGDFKVFKDYEKIGQDWKPASVQVTYTEKELENDSVRAKFVDGLRHGNGFDVIRDCPSLIDKYPEILAIFVEELRRGFGIGILEKDLSLVERHPEIKEFVVGELKKGKMIWVLTRFPSLADEYPEIRAAVVEELKSEHGSGNGFTMLEKNPSLIEKYPDVYAVFADALKKGYGYRVLERNMSFIEKHPDIKEIFLDNLRKDWKGCNILSNDPSLIESNPDVLGLLMNGLKEENIFACDVLEKNPSLVKGHPEILSLIVKMLKGGKGVGIIDRNPELVGNYPEIMKAFLGLLGDGDGFNVLSNNVSLIDNHPEIRAVFARVLKKGRSDASRILERNTRLVDYPEIRSYFLKGLREEWLISCDILENNPSIIERHADVREVFIEKLRGGRLFEVLKHRMSLVNEYPEIKELFMDNFEDKDGYFAVEMNPWIIEGNPDIMDAFVKEMNKGAEGSFYFAENDPSLVDKYPSMRSPFNAALMKGDRYASNAIGKAPSLVDKYDDVRRALLYGMEKGYESLFEAVSQNPYLIGKYPEIQKNFIEALKEPSNSYFIRYISDVQVIKHVLDKDPNNGYIRMYVIENENPETDESKLYKLCKEFASKDYRFLDEFFERYHKMSGSASFQKDFWDYIDGSNYVFEIIRDHHDEVPDYLIAKYAASDDEDIRWIASQYAETGIERKASKIARRVYLMETIPGRIMQAEMDK